MNLSHYLNRVLAAVSVLQGRVRQAELFIGCKASDPEAEENPSYFYGRDSSIVTL